MPGRPHGIIFICFNFISVSFLCFEWFSSWKFGAAVLLSFYTSMIVYFFQRFYVCLGVFNERDCISLCLFLVRLLSKFGSIISMVVLVIFFTSGNWLPVICPVPSLPKARWSQKMSQWWDAQFFISQFHTLLLLSHQMNITEFFCVSCFSKNQFLMISAADFAQIW